MTVYAKWIPATDTRHFTITFDSMRGTPVEPMTADYQSVIQKPKDPTIDSVYLTSTLKHLMVSFFNQTLKNESNSVIDPDRWDEVHLIP